MDFNILYKGRMANRRGHSGPPCIQQRELMLDGEERLVVAILVLLLLLLLKCKGIVTWLSCLLPGQS